ncbi:hypothetical protein AB3Y40_05400 [Yoonia sp. R2331]|uniref:hypothetical protein n=1 Tax=Yoonia sp. R2331 TaxID=3237238 RepID=UPI0034E414B2
MKRFLPLTAFVALSACANGIQIPDFRGSNPAPVPAVAPAPTPAPVMLTAKERLVGAIEANGCQLNASNVGAILSEATIGTEELKSLTAELSAEGRAEVAGDGAIRVTTSTCA